MITGFIFNRQPTKNRGRVSLFTIKAGDVLEFAEVESEDGGHGRVAPRAWGVSQGPLSLATVPRLTWILYVATTAPHWTLTMPVSITDPSEFERLTQSIASDMQSLSLHWTLYNKLQDALDTYEPEFNESQTFWYLTFEAHRDVSLFRLCRLYDQHCSALNLKNWLVALRDNPQFFTVSKPTPDPSTLKQDILSVMDNDPAVIKVVKLRNNALAHRAVTPIVSPRAAVHCSLPYRDIDVLIDRARDIVNRYTLLLNRETYSTTIVGHDDYQHLLNAVRKSRENG